MIPLLRAADATIDAVGDRQLVATITTDAIDRYGEVILPKGIDLAAYRKNPIVLWGHDSSEPPIGRCQWVKPDDSKRALIAKVEFAQTEDAEEIWQLYKQGFCKAFSVGAKPIEGSPPTTAEIKARPEMASCKWVWRKIELHELSCVPIPANPEALVIAISKGVISPSEAIQKQLGIRREPVIPRPEEPPASDEPDLPPLVGRRFGEVHAALVHTIRSESPEAIARHLLREEMDRMRGKV